PRTAFVLALSAVRRKPPIFDLSYAGISRAPVDTLIAYSLDEVAEARCPKGFEEFLGGQQDNVCDRGHILKVWYRTHVDQQSPRHVALFHDPRHLGEESQLDFFNDS